MLILHNLYGFQLPVSEMVEIYILYIRSILQSRLWNSTHSKFRFQNFQNLYLNFKNLGWVTWDGSYGMATWDCNMGWVTWDGHMEWSHGNVTWDGSHGMIHMGWSQGMVT